MSVQVANNIIAEHMKKAGFEYSLSVFLPEAGLNMDIINFCRMLSCTNLNFLFDVGCIKLSFCWMLSCTNFLYPAFCTSKFDIFFSFTCIMDRRWVQSEETEFSEMM